MRRALAGWLAGFSLAIVAAACGPSDDGGSSSASGGSYATVCSQYTTCGSCTPVTGCGWCFNATGGQCASDPDQCAFSSNAEFTWTWEPPGCPDVDASVGPVSTPSHVEAGVQEASPGFDAAAASDGGGAEAAPADAGLADVTWLGG
jgi:hypothetical protein